MIRMWPRLVCSTFLPAVALTAGCHSGQSPRLLRFRGSDGTWGYLDGRGSVLVSAQFCQAEASQDGFALAYSKTERGGCYLCAAPLRAMVVRSNGRVIPLRQDVDYVAYIGERLIFFHTLWGTVGVMKADGRILFEELEGKRVWKAFSEGLAPCAQEGKMGFIDHGGRFVIQPRYDYVWAFDGGVALVNVGGVRGNRKNAFRDGVVGGRWEYVNRDGGTILGWTDVSCALGTDGPP